MDPMETRPLDCPSQPSATDAGAGSPTLGGAVSLEFLGLTDRAGSLGRLGLYEVLEQVGQGGMGLVLRAWDERLNRVVAIKVLLPALASDLLARRRFLREARAAAAVCHEPVVTIHAVDVDEAAGRPYRISP
jgi:serine/threonine protein kinase